MKPLLTMLLTVASSVTFAGDASAESQAGTDVSAAYFGELITHPGLAGGPKFSLVDRSWFDLTAGPVLGFYVHPRNHTGLFLDGELETRYTAPFGLFGTLGVSAGYHHTWLGGDTLYVRADDGSVKETFDWGRPHFKPGMSLGFGWDFAKNRLGPLRVFSRLDIFGRMPFNHAFLPQIALQVGAVYRFGGGAQ